MRSGSLSPTYRVGSLTVVGAVDATNVATGMLIVFEDPQRRGHLVVHRVADGWRDRRRAGVAC